MAGSVIPWTFFWISTRWVIFVAAMTVACSDDDSGDSHTDRRSWSAFGEGLSPDVLSVAVLDSTLYATGVVHLSVPGGIARWDGEEWRPVGGGLNSSGHTLITNGSDLIVGGGFTIAGDVAASRVARWDGAEWHAMGGVTEGGVSAFTIHQGDVIAGGTFTRIGGVVASHVARWDGDAWRPLGDGLDGPVVSMISYRGELVAVGAFDSSGAEPVGQIARWTGERWMPWWQPVDAHIVEIAVHQGSLYAGARYSSPGDYSSRIIEWDGFRWRTIPGDFLESDGYSSEITMLISYENELYVGGSFSTVGGQDIPGIARWRGYGWAPVGRGFDRNVFTAVPWNESLVVGGAFRRSGEQELVGIARWGPAENSVIDTIEFPTQP